MRAGRKFLAILAVALTLPLAGCGDKEPERAKAFAELLQTRLLYRPGVHFPNLTDEEREKIGHFSDDLAVLRTFDDDLTAIMRDLAKSIHPAPANVQPLDLPKYRPDFVAARSFLTGVSAGVDSVLAKAQGAREKLHQPEEVKVKFDAAFEQMVTQPASALREIIPLALPTLDSEIEIADFVDTHKADIKAVGGQFSVSKPAVRKQLEALVATYAERQAKVQTARRKLELVIEGH
jgi:hypothetical protein